MMSFFHGKRGRSRAFARRCRRDVVSRVLTAMTDAFALNSDRIPEGNPSWAEPVKQRSYHLLYLRVDEESKRDENRRAKERNVVSKWIKGKLSLMHFVY